MSAPEETVPDSGEDDTPAEEMGGKVLVAYFSCTGNTEGIAGHIVNILGADVYQIVPEEPYTDADLNYNDSSSRTTIEMNDSASRPAISGSVENMEEYDFSGKTIVPFCSHGGGRFGQSLTAIAKLVPDATLGEGLSVHYSGGSSLAQDVTDWLETNQIPLAE